MMNLNSTNSNSENDRLGNKKAYICKKNCWQYKYKKSLYCFPLKSIMQPF